MKVTVNGEDTVIEKEQLTVTELLKFMKVDMPDMVSVELNGSFLERNNFETTKVKDQDSLEFLYFMGGGSKLG
ncbi:MAG: sulfur carrier protein ThiS [Spirochaetia bacterium]|nr:sulfur carrier protein ThiS [Spirochaetia bacterium]